MKLPDYLGRSTDEDIAGHTYCNMGGIGLGGITGYSGIHLEKGCEANGFIALPIFNRHVAELETLVRPKDAPPHKDPFDRILLAQAKSEGMKFMTHDGLIPYYNESFIVSV